MFHTQPLLCHPQEGLPKNGEGKKKEMMQREESFGGGIFPAPDNLHTADTWVELKWEPSTKCKWEGLSDPLNLHTIRPQNAVGEVKGSLSLTTAWGEALISKQGNRRGLGCTFISQIPPPGPHPVPCSLLSGACRGAAG